MNFSEADTSGGFFISAYEPGLFRVGGTSYRHSLIVTPGRVVGDWAVPSAAALTGAHMEAVLALEPELIVLGTGATQEFPDMALLGAVMARGVGIEIMDSGAACRTYNILMSEGRRVAAALIPI